MGNWQEVGCSGGWMGRSISRPTPITGLRSRGHFLGRFTIKSRLIKTKRQIWHHSRPQPTGTGTNLAINELKTVLFVCSIISAPLVLAGSRSSSRGFVALTDACSTHPQPRTTLINRKADKEKERKNNRSISQHLKWGLREGVGLTQF